MFVLCMHVRVYFQSLELCSTCYEKYGHEHAMRKQSIAAGGSRAAAGSVDSSSDVIRRCIDMVAHATACTHGTACPRQPECGKMMGVLRHARACAVRTTCTVCQQLMALCVTHARACAIESSACRVPFCAELRRHIERRQTLQRQQQHLMDDRRRALMTGTDSHATQVSDVQPDDADTSQRCAGKGGGGKAEQPVPATATNTSTAAKDHLAAATDTGALRHSIASDSAQNSTVVTPQLNTSNCSDVSHVNGDVPAVGGGTADTLRHPSVPKTATSSVSDTNFVETKSAGDGPTPGVLHATECSARHQMVVGCLRVVKKLHPSMSKQNLLQLLCHCSRQQLTALQDKVN